MAKDVKMMYFEDDIKKIQVKSNMYVKNYGVEGVLHLINELLHNAIDECNDPESEGQSIVCTIDRLEDSITVRDDGRGIPEDDYPLDICCTKLQAGSKFIRDTGTPSAGEFGVGITVCNALSDLFRLTSYRKKEKTVHTIEFEQGVKTKDEKGSIGKGGIKHGTVVKMIPSKKYLGPTAMIDPDRVFEWIDNISYFIEEHIKIQLDIMNGFKQISSTLFTKKDPIGLINKICSETFLVKPIHFTRNDTFKESVINPNAKDKNTMVEKDRTAKYGFVIAYDDYPDFCYDSYCNFTNTREGGVHVDAVEKALCNFLQKTVKDSLTDAEKEKFDILWNDVRTGLKLTVYVQTDSNVGFEGNAKEKIKSDVLYNVIYNGAVEEIPKYFNENQDKLKQIIKIIKTNAKARAEANRVRIATTKEAMDPIKEILINNFTKCNSTGKNEYREIFIVEGGSAKGSAVRYRYTYFQAFYAVRGMTANPFKKGMIGLMDPTSGNKEWREFVHILRCGIGRSFDINKLWYKKIIIMVDADIDGSGIFSAMCAFFVTCLPELVEAGYVYRALPPLYKVIDGKKEIFVHNKEEYVELYRSKVIKAYDVVIPQLGDGKIDKSTFKEFLIDTADYAESLNLVAAHYKITKYLIERVLAFFVDAYKNINEQFDPSEELKSQKLLTKFMSFIQKRYPEIKYHDEDGTLSGVADGHFCSIELNSRFIRKCHNLIPTYKKYGYILLVKDKGKDEVKMTMCEFAEDYQKYIPNIDMNKGGQRYKGLGEMSPKDLFETTLDPFRRTLIRLTLKDMKNAMETFNVLHGNKKKDKLSRKKMMREYHINPNDLDN